MTIDFSALLPVLSLIISVLVLIGGFIALKTGYGRASSDIQSSVIEALKTQNELQGRQIDGLDKEVKRLTRVVSTVQVALSHRGLKIEIGSDSVTLIDEQAKQTTTVQVHLAEEKTSP